MKGGRKDDGRCREVGPGGRGTGRHGREVVGGGRGRRGQEVFNVFLFLRVHCCTLCFLVKILGKCPFCVGQYVDAPIQYIWLKM